MVILILNTKVFLLFSFGFDSNSAYLKAFKFNLSIYRYEKSVYGIYYFRGGDLVFLIVLKCTLMEISYN